MENKRGLGITLTDILHSTDRSLDRQSKGKITRSDPLSGPATPLESFGYTVLFRLSDRRFSIQDLVDQTGFTREDLIDIRFGTLPQDQVLPKIGKLEEVLGYNQGELLDEFNEIVGH